MTDQKAFSCHEWPHCGCPGGTVRPDCPGLERNRAAPKKQMSIASSCAMTCAEGGFHVFLTEREGVNIASTEAATAFVRGYCRIESRKELNVEGPARNAWLALKASYDGWLRS